MTDRNKELDRALGRDERPEDPELAGMKDVATHLEDGLQPDAPRAGRERVMFMEAVAARRRGVFARRMSFALVAAVLIGLGFIARGALPGETLYPVRKVLGSAGLADSALDEVSSHISAARALLDAAEAIAADEPDRAERLAGDAIFQLGLARDHLQEVGHSQRDQRVGVIDTLEERAFAVIRIVPTLKAHPSPSPTPDDDRGDDGNRGPSGDDDPDDNDDNSGSGSDDDGLEDDDSSGPGSDDDGLEEDDSSGPGSNDR